MAATEDPLRGLMDAVLAETPATFGVSRVRLDLNDSSSFNATYMQPDLMCIPDMMPSGPEYLAAIDFGGTLLLCLGFVATIFIFVLYGDCVNHVLRHGLSTAKSSTVLVISVYPVVALAILTASVCPRAQLIAEATTQLTFTTAWYNFFCLLLDYSGGKSALLAYYQSGHNNSGMLTPRVPPLCCFWCCMPPKLAINNKNLVTIRCLILQLPIVQGLIYLTLLVVASERQSLYSAQHTLYATPLMFISIFTALWGMGMFARLLGPGLLQGYYLPQKMLALQFVLIFSKLQGLGVRVATWAGGFPCHPTLPPTVFANLVYNTLMMTEMVVLQVIAWRLYKRPLPSKIGTPCSSDSEPSSKLPSISSVISERARS